MRTAQDAPELRWFRSITSILPAIPYTTNGHAATLDEAKNQVPQRPGRRRRRPAHGAGVLRRSRADCSNGQA
jgi:hypothetical protein